MFSSKSLQSNMDIASGIGENRGPFSEKLNNKLPKTR
jgi:hypothetical protein